MGARSDKRQRDPQQSPHGADDNREWSSDDGLRYRRPSFYDRALSEPAAPEGEGGAGVWVARRCRVVRSRLVALTLTSLALLAPAARAQAPAPQAESEGDKAFASIEWTKGPAKVVVGDEGDLQVLDDFAYTGSAGAQKLMQLL